MELDGKAQTLQFWNRLLVWRVPKPPSILFLLNNEVQLPPSEAKIFMWKDCWYKWDQEKSCDRGTHTLSAPAPVLLTASPRKARRSGACPWRTLCLLSATSRKCKCDSQINGRQASWLQIFRKDFLLTFLRQSAGWHQQPFFFLLYLRVDFFLF